MRRFNVWRARGLDESRSGADESETRIADLLPPVSGTSDRGTWSCRGIRGREDCTGMMQDHLRDRPERRARWLRGRLQRGRRRRMPVHGRNLSHPSRDACVRQRGRPVQGARDGTCRRSRARASPSWRGSSTVLLVPQVKESIRKACTEEDCGRTAPAGQLTSGSRRRQACQSGGQDSGGLSAVPAGSLDEGSSARPKPSSVCRCRS